jgi:shikimate dehydrogenase
MYEAAFAELGLNWRYLTIEVYPKDLAAAMKGVRAFNMRGVNLTIPHKVAVLPYLDDVKPDAALMGAVNTVVRVGDRLVGENADGKGFMTALTRDAKVDPRGKRVVILGAGGAARSITVELALAGAERLTVVNRSPGRGQELVELLNSRTPVKAEFAAWSGSYAISAGTDILVNATSIGLFIHTPMTPFLAEAGRQGAQIVDGLGMLVYQGAIGFKLWTGLDAPVQVMYGALARAFGLA